MTIAMCAVMPEGVVFGADSTSSVFHDGSGFHYFNHNQKLFQVGENSTLGIVTWGLGGINDTSYRTLIAELDDDLRATPAASIREVAERWGVLLWARYTAALAVEIARIATLAAMGPYDPAAAPPAANARSEAEEKELAGLRQNLYVGFCIGGYVLPDRTPMAFQVNVFPEAPAAPVPTPVTINFWGAPNYILRLLNGWDNGLKDAIMGSGKWGGTEAELVQELNKSALNVGMSTLRDGIDFVYSSIHSTIKALKFSHLSQICGGPIELAVISTDRRFRWVRHKKWDSAITEGDIT
ncbi:MAG: hypothetical protein DI591_09440 [Citromicrobium sp.]|nr:MAG: hypothetical protein DI591_09440 [Citromicrobium sp.]